MSEDLKDNSSEDLKIEVQGKVALLTLNRPDKLNAFTPP